MGKVTIKVTLKAEPNDSGLHNVRIRLTKDRLTRYYALSPFLKPKQFNPNGKRDLQNWIRPGHDSAVIYNNIILTALQRCETVVSTLEKGGDTYTIDEVINALRSGGNLETVGEYIDAFAERRHKLAGKDLGKIRTANNYIHTLRVWRLFENESSRKRPFLIQQLTKKVIEDFKAWMNARYSSENTTAGHLTHLKTVVKTAISEGLIAYDKDPMRGIKYAMKRKKVARLQPGDIDRIEAYVPPPQPKNPGRTITPVFHAKSMALAMYYLHGSRIGDVISLRRRHYVVDHAEVRIIYIAGKNKQEKSVLLPDFVVDLLSPYLVNEAGKPKEPAEFLFPYLPPHFDKMKPNDQVLAMKQSIQRASNQIKRMGKAIGLEKHITPHLFRHSFADLLRREGEDLLTIQMVLGHADPRTTRDYMETLDQSAVDKVSSYFARHRAASKTVGQQECNSEENVSLQPNHENE